MPISAEPVDELFFHRACFCWNIFSASIIFTSNSNISGTSGRGLFIGQVLSEKISVSITFASVDNSSRGTPVISGKIILYLFLALQTLYHYKRNNVYRDCQMLCDLGFKCHRLIFPVSQVEGVLHFEVTSVLFITRTMIFDKNQIRIYLWITLLISKMKFFASLAISDCGKRF